MDSGWLWREMGGREDGGAREVSREALKERSKDGSEGGSGREGRRG